VESDEHHELLCLQLRSCTVHGGIAVIGATCAYGTSTDITRDASACASSSQTANNAVL
jgi:hypothetical protein